MLIGFTGKKESGKTKAAEFLARKGFTRLSFATPLKGMLSLLLIHLGENEAACLEDKEKVIESLGVSYRHLAQTLGTEWGRLLIHPDLWVYTAEYRLEGHDNVVFDDVRFENEAALIRARGGLVIHLSRETGNTDTHTSEAGVRLVAGDAVIRNDGSLETLYEQLELLLKEKNHG
jgi:hypothetical protein